MSQYTNTNKAIGDNPEDKNLLSVARSGQGPCINADMSNTQLVPSQMQSYINEQDIGIHDKSIPSRNFGGPSDRNCRTELNTPGA